MFGLPTLGQDRVIFLVLFLLKHVFESHRLWNFFTIGMQRCLTILVGHGGLILHFLVVGSLTSRAEVGVASFHPWNMGLAVAMVTVHEAKQLYQFIDQRAVQLI